MNSESEWITLDTNILVYAIDHSEPEKHKIARQIILEAARKGTCQLTLQALNEFSAVAISKELLSPKDNRAQVKDWADLFGAVPADLEDLLNATLLVERHSISFWDTVLCSTAKRAQVEVILSEDFQDGRDLGGVRFRNPFRDLP